MSLSQIIPIPFLKNNVTHILKSNTKFLLNNGTLISEIPAKILSECIQTSKITLCNSLYSDQLLKINNCTNAILAKNPFDKLCTYEKMPETTKITKTSDKSVYIYVLKPVLLKIFCGTNSKIVNVTHSQEIFYGNYCKIFKPINNFMQNDLSTIIKIETELIEPDFSIFENGFWSENSQYLNKYNFEIQQLYRDFKQNQMEYERRARLLEIPEANFLSFLSDFLSENIIIYLAIYVLVPIILVLLLTCCICHFTK